MSKTNRNQRTSHKDGLLAIHVNLPEALRDDTFFRSPDFAEELMRFVSEKLTGEDVFLLRDRALARGDAALRAKLGLPEKELSGPRGGTRGRAKPAAAVALGSPKTVPEMPASKPRSAERELASTGAVPLASAAPTPAAPAPSKPPERSSPPAAASPTPAPTRVEAPGTPAGSAIRK